MGLEALDIDEVDERGIRNYASPYHPGGNEDAREMMS